MTDCSGLSLSGYTSMKVRELVEKPVNAQALKK